jgi:hypothetical protein
MRSKTSPRADALSLLTGLFERGEEVVNVFLEELLGNKRVREQLGKTAGRAAHAKKRVDKNMERVLSALNVPSRGDYNRLLTKIEALQGSLVNVSMKLDRLLAAQHQHAAPAPPPRRSSHKVRKRASA